MTYSVQWCWTVSSTLNCDRGPQYCYCFIRSERSMCPLCCWAAATPFIDGAVNEPLPARVRQSLTLTCSCSCSTDSSRPLNVTTNSTVDWFLFGRKYGSSANLTLSCRTLYARVHCVTARYPTARSCRTFFLRSNRPRSRVGRTMNNQPPCLSVCGLL